MNVISTFFGSPFSDQSTTLSTRQPVFVRMLQVVWCVPLRDLWKYNESTQWRTLGDKPIEFRWMIVIASKGNEKKWTELTKI